MTADETPGTANNRRASFPVIQIKSEGDEEQRAPFLHLGAGGPGAPMGLSSEYSVWATWHQLSDLSTGQGRDLYLIDPRGTGEANPLLMCQHFVDGVIPRWRENLTIRQSYERGSADFKICIDELLATGLDFSSYNSQTVVRDLEQLRTAVDAERWVLYGASYGSVYAQLYARDYPEHVEAMILDSATFLDIPRHEVLVRETVQPYQKLFNYCEFTRDCAEGHSPEATKNRFWQLVAKLDEEPLEMLINHPATSETIRMPLSGWRFLDSVLWGVYGEDIFSDFPTILDEVERNEVTTLRPYTIELLDFLLDDKYGDISASAHYCVEQKPYLEEEKIKEQIELIPYPYARDIARLGQQFSDYCEAMNITNQSRRSTLAIATDVPTLFVHGTLDSVTLLEHVTSRLERFDNGFLVTSSQAHIVLDDNCVMAAALAFLSEGYIQPSTQACENQ